MPQTTKLNIIGNRFGRLVAIAFVPDSGRWARFLFKCDCGQEKIILFQSVSRGVTLSCGCLRKEIHLNPRLIHGHAGKKRTRTYSSWASMMDRCEWGCNKAMYLKYGAVGIRVTPEWHNYENFLADMGERPHGTSIDRIDGTRGYEPGNCRWATRKVQSLNTTQNPIVKYSGSNILVYFLCEKLGLSRSEINSRAYRRGGDYVLALRSVGVDCDYATSRSLQTGRVEV